MAVKNKDIIEKALNSVIVVVGRISSQSYALVVLQTILQKLEQKYPFAKDIQVKTTYYSSSQESIKIREAANKADPKEAGRFINDVMRELMRPFSKTEESKQQMINEIKGYIGHDYMIKMQNIGVKF